MIRVAINGCGRIGRSFLRASSLDDRLKVVAINDLSDARTMAHLIKYDSVHGIFPHKVTCDDHSLFIDEDKILMLQEKEPSHLPWKKLDIDVVVESSGIFASRVKSQKHLDAGAKKVIISAPAKDADLLLLMGINEKKYDHKAHHLISNGSCTANGLAPLLKVLDEAFGIKKAHMTTVHPYTNNQVLLDAPQGDLRRARASGLSIIPTSTTAIDAVKQVMPQFKGKLEGYAVRVPVPAVALIDLVTEVSTEVTMEKVNQAFTTAENGPLKGILGTCREPLVSIDYQNDPRSTVVDLSLTQIIGGNMVKVVAWYDNEWGYSNRLKDLIRLIFSK